MFKWIAKLFTPSVKEAQDEAKEIEKVITKTISQKKQKNNSLQVKLVTLIN